MDFGQLFLVLRRHWLVFGLALAITIAATAGIEVKGPTAYQSSVQMTMLNGPKINALPGTFGNPYLSFNTTLQIDVDLLTRNLTAPASVNQLKSLGVNEQLTATLAANALGPFMQLTVLGPDRAHVAVSMNTYIRFAERRWLQLQHLAKAPKGSIVALQVIAPPGPPTLAIKKKFELTGGVAILGLIFSLVIPAIVESRQRRRAARRGASGRRARPVADDLSDEDLPAFAGTTPYDESSY
jgi:hypothetical protein